MGVRRIRRCKSCGRRFTPKYQKPAQNESWEAPQAETAEPVESEAAEATQATTAEAEEPGRVEPTDTQTPTSIEPEEPSDEHQTVGL